MKLILIKSVKYIFLFSPLLLFLIIFFTRNLASYGFITSDETVNYSFASSQKKFGVPYFISALNTLTQSSIYKPRGTITNQDKVLSRKFLGYPLIIGSIARLFNIEISAIFNAVIFISLFIVIYKIFLELKLKNSLLLSLLVALMPPITYWTYNYYFENVLGLLFFALGILFVVKMEMKKKNQTVFTIFSIFFFTLGGYVRYDYLLFYLPLLIMGLFFFHPKIKQLIIYLLFSIIFLTPLLIINNSLYGHPLSSGQSSKIENRSPYVGGGSNISVYPKNLKVVTLALSFHLCFFIVVIYSIIKDINKPKNENSKIMFYLSICTIISFLFFSKFWLAGVPAKANFYIRDSYVRYFLPMYFLIFMITSYIVDTYINNKRLFKIAIFLIIIASVLISANQILRDDRLRSKYIDLAENIINHTESDSIIYIDNMDKVIFPHREIGYLSSDKIKENYEEIVDNILTVNQLNRKQYFYLCSLEENNNFLNFALQKGIIFTNIENCLYLIDM